MQHVDRWDAADDRRRTGQPVDAEGQDLMPRYVALLGSINVGGRRIKMDALCALCTSLKLRNPQTYVQSGNVVFRTSERNLSRVAMSIEKRIEHDCGFRTDVIVRSANEMRDVVARNAIGV